MNQWHHLSTKSLNNEILSQEESLSVLNAKDDELLSLIHHTSTIRLKFFGKKVKLNFLLNVKSGLCPEDCHYCSQSSISKATISKYPIMKKQKIVEMFRHAQSIHAKRFCIVGSGRGPNDNEVCELSDTIQDLKKENPNMEICVCLGLLQEKQAVQLKTAGADAYNHNLNTTEKHYGQICSTHTYQDRIDTVQTAQKCGFSSCSGCLLGMGESISDRIELACELRKLHVDSIPINFLEPILGTKLEGHNDLSPQSCLKILCLFRLLNPRSEIRIAGGRELHLGSLQPLGLYVANSIFIGDYLTTKGQEPHKDLEMIKDLGFEVVKNT